MQPSLHRVSSPCPLSFISAAVGSCPDRAYHCTAAEYAAVALIYGYVGGGHGSYNHVAIRYRFPSWSASNFVCVIKWLMKEHMLDSIQPSLVQKNVYLSIRNVGIGAGCRLLITFWDFDA